MARASPLRGLQILRVVGVLAGCTAAPPSAPGPACTTLFGTPNDRSGLDATQCRPTCACGEGGTFTPRAWTPSALAALRALTQVDAPAGLRADPYAAPVPPSPSPETVCAAVFAGLPAGRYRMQTFARAAEARAAGGVVSHAGACGLCSSLTDLAVYAGEPDLTAPVRACGLANLGRFAGLVDCLGDLGFTRPCAEIWAYNTEHTRAACGATCFALVDAPYHNPDGGLNACLACDETQSGPVFKAIAGRTRRNSGLANAMCRPCEEVVRLAHAYPGTW